jgi:hypothetical protein
MSKQNVILALAILFLIGQLFQLYWTISESLENNTHCEEYRKRVEASRVGHLKAFGCVAIMPDGRMLAEPK